jgi:hypothetical protein
MVQVQEERVTNLIVESEDPGTKNAAYALARYSFTRGKVKVELIYCGMLVTPLTFVQGDIGPALQKYLKEIKTIRNKMGVGKPDLIIRERFQARGLTGPVVEIISAAFGARAIKSLDEHPKRKFAGIMASQWKTQAKKMFDLDGWYIEFCKPSHNRVKNLKYIGPPHVLDACLIGMYGAGKAFGMKNPYECLAKATEQKKFLDQVKKIHKKGVGVRP